MNRVGGRDICRDFCAVTNNQFKVNAPAGLNLRDMPDLSSNVIGLLRDGTVLTVHSIVPSGGRNWAEIGGFVAMEYLDPLGETFVRVPDVSQYQGKINWSVMRSKGIDHVMIRGPIGDGGRDRMFEDHWTGAGAAGLKRGVYTVFLPHTDPLRQAADHKRFLEEVQPELVSAGDFELGGNHGRFGLSGRVWDYLSAVRYSIQPGRSVDLAVYTGLYFWSFYVGNVDWSSHFKLWISHPEPDGRVIPPDQCVRPLPPRWSNWFGYQWSWTQPGREFGAASRHLDMSYFILEDFVL